MTDELFPARNSVPELSLDRELGPEWDDLSVLDQLNPQHRKRIRGPAWLAWLVVIGLTLVMMLNAFMTQSPQTEVEMSKGELLQPVLMGKFALGLRELSGQRKGAELKQQAEDFLQAIDFGPLEQRFCHAILVNEFFGPEQALQALADLRQKTAKAELEYNPQQARAETILTDIFNQLQTEQTLQIAETDRSFLIDAYPWYGELALNSQSTDSSRRAEILSRAEFSVILMLLGVVCLVGLLIAGVIAWFIFMARIFSGSLRHRVVDDSRYGSVYIETFALWFLLFVGISVAIGFSGVKSMSMSIAAIMMLLPLSALIWPILRGVPASDLLQDVGLQPRNPFVEVLAGCVAYLALLPPLVVGIICSMILMAILSLFQSSGPLNEFAPNGVPHPIANEAFGGDPLQVMMTILFIAAVLAPLTEEIMFRGVLYRTLRDSSRQMARWVSILFAALFSSLIFAAIHPQGIVGIPVLTILAFGFCLVRQWRGSLIAPITMHAIHNGLATCFLIPLLI